MLTDRNPALEPQMNVLIGGHRGTLNMTTVIVRSSFTYHPIASAKRGVDIGYDNHNNTAILVENNYFTGGANAMEIKNIADQVTVRNNTFWSSTGMVVATLDPPSSNIVFENNRYIDNGHFNLSAFRASILGSGETDTVMRSAAGRPAENRVFTRVNRYEPQRVHLIVYNWKKSPVMQLDLSSVLSAGQHFKILEVQ
jgi:hypothetical protein